MKRDLIIHMGYSKTASTWLQKTIFPSMEDINYIGIDEFSNIQRKLKDVPLWCNQFNCLFNKSPIIWNNIGTKILSNIVEHTELEKDIILSDENILQGRGFFRNDLRFPHQKTGKDPYLLKLHINEMRKILDNYGIDTIKILIIIRRQDTWLASRYAQSSAFITNASQKNFKYQVEMILPKNEEYYRTGVWLNYFFLYEQLANIVGEENIKILPFELLENKPADFVSAISTFFKKDIPNIDFNKRVNVLSENRKNTERMKWKLRKPIIRIFPRRFNIVLRKYTGLCPSISKKIFLDDVIKKMVLREFSESNKMLDKRINQKLYKYGYY